MLLRVILDRLGSAPVGIALAEHGIDRAAHDLGVADPGVLFGVGGGILREIGDLAALGLELGDCRLELGHGGADVGQFDDVGLGLECQGAELGEVVTHALRLGQELGKLGQNAARERDVPGLHRDPGVLGECLHDRQKRVRGERWGFVGLGVDDGGIGRHGDERVGR